MSRQANDLVVAFNVNLVDYVHQSWLPAEYRDAWEQVRRCTVENARHKASAWALQHFGLAGTHCFDFAASRRRLLLLDPASLREVVFWLGLIVLRYQLRTWTDKTMATALYQELGEERAEFWRRRVLPWKHVPRLHSPQMQLGQVVPAAVCKGTEVLFGCYDEDELALTLRAKLKLIHHTAPKHSPILVEERRNAVMDYAIGCIVQHRLLQWHWLF